MVARMAGCAGALAGLFLGAMPAAADGIVSAYTKIDADTTCTTFAAASADDGGATVAVE